MAWDACDPRCTPWDNGMEFLNGYHDVMVHIDSVGHPTILFLPWDMGPWDVPCDMPRYISSMALWNIPHGTFHDWKPSMGHPTLQ